MDGLIFLGGGLWALAIFVAGGWAARMVYFMGQSDWEEPDPGEEILVEEAPKLTAVSEPGTVTTLSGRRRGGAPLV